MSDAALTSLQAHQPAAPAWAGVIAGLPHAAWVVALDSLRVVAANRGAATLLGRSAAALVGEDALALAASPEDLMWWDAAAAGQAQALNSDTIIAGADGATLHVQRSIGLVGEGPGGAATHALVMISDRSVEQRALDERDAMLAELQATLEATADGILVTDLSGRIRACNRLFAEMWDLAPALLSAADDAGVQTSMARAVEQADAYDERVQALRHAPLVSASDRLQLRSGRVLERVTRPLLRAGRPQGRVWSFRDVTASIAANERIETLSRSDALTGLPNRARLAECVSEAAERAGRERCTFALLVIDLDRFRQINDTLGQATGDRALLEVAQRLQACLRGDDVLARVGGDQFAVLLSPADAGAAEAAARRMLNVVARPCDIDGEQFTITCSIGIALAPSQAQHIDDLTRCAETAMRAVKDSGRANYRLHQARAEGDRRSRMELDHAMRQALVAGRFRLHYQPQVDLASGAIVGAEALLRWRDPELGDIPPGRFIPVAEDSGFIVPIGDWVLSQAVRQAALWNSKGLRVPIAVNVSALQFQQPHFVERVAGVLAISGVAPELLELELTESILVHDAADALLRLQALARLGVALSIDDFGTGYSSLAYLKRFPIRKLKIDRSFVSSLPSDDSDAAIVRAILQMAQALGLRVIAEGVETDAQREFLRNAGCDEFQGYLFAPALDSLSFEQRLLSQAPSRPEPRRGRGRGRMSLVVR